MWRGIIAAVVLCALPASAWAQAAVLTFRSEYTVDVGQSTGQLVGQKMLDGAFYAVELLETPKRNATPPAQLVTFDNVTGEKSVVVKPTTNRSYVPIAFIDNYIVASGGLYNRISLLDRATAKEIATKRMKDSVLGATIRNGELYLFQSQSLGRFSLTTMETLGERGLPGMRWAGQLANDGIIWVETKSNASDFQIKWTSLDAGRETRSIELPKVQRDPGECGPRVLAVRADRAVVDRGCANLTMVDTGKMEILYNLPPSPPTTRANVAFVGDFLVVGTDAYTPETPAPVSIIEAATGREVARQVIPQGEIYAGPDTLVLKVSPYPGNKLRVMSFGIDTRTALDAKRQGADIVAAFDRAQREDDIYRAAQIMESVALDPMWRSLGVEKNRTYLAAASFYARMLSLDPSRVDEGIQRLTLLTALFPDEASLKVSLTMARRRAAILDVDTAIREPVLESLWKPAQQRPLLAATTYAPGIDWISSDGFLLFDDNYAFLWREFAPDTDKPMIGMDVYDRKTWALVRNIPLTISTAPSGWSDHLDDARIVDGRIWIATTPNGGGQDAGQPTVFVYDTHTLELVKSWRDSGEVRFVVSGGNMITVGCCNGDKTAYDLKTLQPVDTPVIGDIDWYGSEHPAITPESIQLMKSYRSAIRAPSQSYVVDRWRAYSGNPIRLVPVSGGAPIELARVLSGASRSWPVDTGFIYAEGDEALSVDATDRAVSLIRFNLPARTWSTLYSVRLASNSFVRTTSDGRTFFMAVNNTLVAIDVKTGTVIDIASIFSGQLPDGAAAAGNQWVRDMFVDRGRLTVVAHGVIAIVDLDAFYRAAELNDTPFARTQSRLTDR